MITISLHSQPHRTPARRHGRRRQHLAAAILALAFATALSLTGCTPKDSPPNAGTAPATAPATAAPTTPPPAPAYQPATANGPAQNVPLPVLPAKAKEFSKKGLEEFARYWYSTLGYAFETGDAGPMMKISDTGCKTCAAMKSTVTPWHSEGRWIVGGQMVVLSAETTFTQMPDSTYQVITLVRQQQVKYFRSDNSLSEDMGAKPSVADILVATYGGGQWKATTVEHLKGNTA